MGHKLSDGKAVDVSAAASTLINKGDLYRIGLITGYALSTVLAADTDRGLALETDVNTIWKVKLPAGLTPAVGDLLYWTAGAGQKAGDTDLTASVTGQPICRVIIAKNTNGYAAVQLCGHLG
jgi:hypothetical protein